MKSIIIANGSFSDKTSFLKECNTADYIICADGGAKYAYNFGCTPDYVIGDFDSLEPEILDFYIKQDIEVVKYPKEKDYTDTELCIKRAIEIGSTEICILAGVGDRIDHTLGNIGLLHSIKESGIDGYIASDDCYIYICRGELLINGNIGDIVSVIPFKGDALGVSLSGFKYPLESVNINFGSPLGISNEIIEETCKINVMNGEVLVIRYASLE
jgi:thiamine pyrophosphokinase